MYAYICIDGGIVTNVTSTSDTVAQHNRTSFQQISLTAIKLNYEGHIIDFSVAVNLCRHMFAAV